MSRPFFEIAAVIRTRNGKITECFTEKIERSGLVQPSITSALDILKENNMFDKLVEKEKRQLKENTLSKRSTGLVPMGTRLIVERKEAAKTTEGGLIVPDLHQELPCEGVVKAKADKVEGLSVGDRVLFGRYAGTEFVHEGVTYLLMDVEDIQARII